MSALPTPNFIATQAARLGLTENQVGLIYDGLVYMGGDDAEQEAETHLAAMDNEEALAHLAELED